MAELTAKDQLLNKAYLRNPWFTPEWQIFAFSYWASVLKSEDLSRLAEMSKFAEQPKKVGIITAGNIPLVGFHDILCVLLSGHSLAIKPSSDDPILTTWVVKKLLQIAPELSKRVNIVEKLNDCEALIATGTNNSARYFEYYFREVPRLIRRNRNSLAVVSGEESDEELKALGLDIFAYFGLGCRNVSKILFPENYQFSRFFEAIDSYHPVVNHNKYANNYTYHKALFLMNLEKHLDNGFLLLKEDQNMGSPLGCLFFDKYKDKSDVVNYIDNRKETIQIVISQDSFLPGSVAFGKSQFPKLTEFADNINTMDFMSTL